MRRRLRQAALTAARSVPAPMVTALLRSSALGSPPVGDRLIAVTDLDRRLERRPIGFTRRLASGGRYRGRTDEAIDRAVALGGLWEPNITAYVLRCLRPGQVFVDFGANSGYYPVLAAPLVGPTGLVVAVEPSPSVFERLRHNIARNRFAHVVACNVAAGDEPGALPLYVPVGDSRLKASLVEDNIVGDQTIEADVSVLRSADLIPAGRGADVRLVKIDVEGFEPEVVRGLLPVLSDMPSVELVVEVNPAHRGPATAAMFEGLADAGFHPYRIPNAYEPLAQMTTFSTAPAVRLDTLPTHDPVDVIFSRTDAHLLT